MVSSSGRLSRKRLRVRPESRCAGEGSGEVMVVVVVVKRVGVSDIWMSDGEVERDVLLLVVEVQEERAEGEERLRFKGGIVGGGGLDLKCEVRDGMG